MFKKMATMRCQVVRRMVGFMLSVVVGGWVNHRANAAYQLLASLGVCLLYLGVLCVCLDTPTALKSNVGLRNWTCLPHWLLCSFDFVFVVCWEYTQFLTVSPSFNLTTSP